MVAATASQPSSFVGALAYELGEARPTSFLVERGADSKVLDTLALLGVKTYLESTRPVAELAETSMRKTLEAAPCKPEEIDFVLLATESFPTPTGEDLVALRTFRRDLYGAVARVGAGNAFPIGVTFAACGNFLSALQIARSLIVSGAARNVLVSVADCLPPGVPRVIPRVAVLSDAAASCVVSSTPMPGFRIDSIVHHATLSVNDADMLTNFTAYTIEAARAMRQLGADFRRIVPGGFEGFKAIVTNNYTLSAVRGLVRQLGCDDKNVYDANVSRTAHCNAGDIPINLATLIEEKKLAAGDRVLAFGNGASAWALAALEHVAADD